MNRRAFLIQAAAAAAARSTRAVGGERRAHAPRVVVVGGGFAGATCALYLRALSPSLEVLLVDPESHYVTCPMSNSVIAGLRGLDSITVSRAGLERHGVTVVRDSVAAIDAAGRRVRLAGGTSAAYDRLVMAAGIRFLWDRPEGYTEAAATRMPHAWQAGPQTRQLNAQLAAMRGGGVVAISVPAGPMRCPPGPFERASLMAYYLKRRNPRAKILIFDANNHFPRQDAFTDAWRSLYPGMIEWIPVVQGGAVVRVDPAQMTLYTSQGAQRADVVNIIPPQAPAALALQAGLAEARGWCPIDSGSFASTVVADVHVIGDACIADPMPKSGSAANAQAKRCAYAIAAALAEVEAPDTTMQSVCYSLLAADRALSIHARFDVQAGTIKELPATAEALSPEDEAARASQWYRAIVADAFGGG